MNGVLQSWRLKGNCHLSERLRRDSVILEATGLVVLQILIQAALFSILITPLQNLVINT